MTAPSPAPSVDVAGLMGRLTLIAADDIARAAEGVRDAKRLCTNTIDEHLAMSEDMRKLRHSIFQALELSTINLTGWPRFLREAAAALSRMEWLPIEQAPKDGTRVAIARYNEMFGWVRGIGFYASVDGIEGWVPIAGFSEPPGVLGLGEPTLFHLLPSPPSGQEGR